MRVETVSGNSSADKEIRAGSKLGEEKDEYLVREARRGSDAAFGILFQRYQQRMIHIANRILRNREDAEDAVQQAFGRAFLRLEAFQGESRFSTWLTRIVINEALQLLRKRRPGHSSLENRTAKDGTVSAWEIEDAAVTPEERVNRQEMHGMLNEAIGELRPILRTVVKLYEMDEMSSGKAAQALGLTNGTVKARAFRARRLLRRKLDLRLGKATDAGKDYLFAPTRSGRSYGRRTQAVAAAA
jgi:RNA polymerase sigma-70 factor, ECF subfamily